MQGGNEHLLVSVGHCVCYLVLVWTDLRPDEEVALSAVASTHRRRHLIAHAGLTAMWIAAILLTLS